MSRRVVGALLALILIFGGGYLLYSKLFDSPTPAVAEQIEPAELLAPAEPKHVRTPEAEFEVIRVEGQVERQARQGDWVPVQEGDKLPVDESIRTGAAASAGLRLGKTAELELPGESAVAIRAGSDDSVSVSLERGVARVNFVRSGGRVKMGFAKSDAVAEAKEGSFSAITTGPGDIAVASERGSVKLTSAGQSVRIGAGQLSTVAANKAPTQPQAIPKTFFLKVRRPPAVTRTKSTMVSGNATPGTSLSVDGVVTRADHEGKFSLRVPLKEGANQVKISARDVLGRSEQHKLPPIRVDSTAPKVRSDVDW